MHIRDVSGRVRLGKFTLTTGFRMLKRLETALFGNIFCAPVDLVGIENALLECRFEIPRCVSEMGIRYFRARLAGDREERWVIYEMWIRGGLPD